MSLKNRPLTLTINNQLYGPIDVPEGLMMIDFLHEYLDLTGSRLGCGQGICHACVVTVDHDSGVSEEVRTCITGAHYFDGKKVRTIEGYATVDAAGQATELTPVQQAFLEHYSFQCSYCTPGFVTAATLLIERLHKQPIKAEDLETAISQALENHICRCTGYVRYYQAVKEVIEKTPGLLTEEAK